MGGRDEKAGNCETNSGFARGASNQVIVRASRAICQMNRCQVVATHTHSHTHTHPHTHTCSEQVEAGRVTPPTAATMPSSSKHFNQVHRPLSSQRRERSNGSKGWAKRGQGGRLQTSCGFLGLMGFCGLFVTWLLRRRRRWRRGSFEFHARMRLHLSVAFQRVSWAKAGRAGGRGEGVTNVSMHDKDVCKNLLK